MKKFTQVFKICILLMVVTLIAPSVLPLSNVAVAQAATIKLNKKVLELEVGETFKLTMQGTTKKATWTTGNKKIATISKTGNVTAVKAGKTTITATVNKKKYTCKVTVTDAINPNITNAPFKAQEVVALGEINYVIPKEWTNKVYAETGNAIMSLIYPSSADLTVGTSNVTLTITKTATVKPEYSVTKEYFQGLITEELIVSQLLQSGIEATLSEFKTSDYESTLGTAFKTQYTATHAKGVIKQAIYDIYIDNYFFELTITDIGGKVTPDVKTVCEYILNSIQVIEK